jgi:hypothetical protein
MDVFETRVHILSVFMSCMVWHVQRLLFLANVDTSQHLNTDVVSDVKC